MAAGRTGSVVEVQVTPFPTARRAPDRVMYKIPFLDLPPLRGAAGTSSFGQIQSGALEASNVDLTQELVNMITAQRDFQANAQVISTSDQVTQSIINIRG